MSLLSSLARLGAGFQQTAESRGAAQPAQKAGQAKTQPQAGGKNDDSVTLNGGERPTASTRLAMDSYKSDVGQDSAFVRETLRHKLAEYSLNPTTRLAVQKSEGGKLSLEARIPENLRQQIEQDLNNNRGFKDAFGRLSVNEPTLAFVDTALKLNKAYGVNNSLLDTLVSDNQQFNGLGDLVHRYDSLRQTLSAERIEAAGQRRNYAFNLNVRA